MKKDHKGASRLYPLFLACLWLLPALLAGGCLGDADQEFQGYIEGDFIYISSPLGGTLERLHVGKGESVKAGQPLFELENGLEAATVKEAEELLRQAENRLADLGKGRRPSEVAAIRARLRQTEAAYSLARDEYQRRDKLFSENTISEEERDQSKSQYTQTGQKVREITAELETALLGGRTDEIGAAEAAMEASRAKLEQAQWNLDQKKRTTPQDALVHDTIFDQGEWVPAGRPVVALLPAKMVKARFFVPETVVGTLSLGQKALITFDGGKAPVGASISYISDRAEYTPPVIYSSQSRTKLVFMIEARPDEKQASMLHPGQPVDISLMEEGGNE